MAKVMRLKALEIEIRSTQTEKTKIGLLGELEVMLKLKDNLPNNYTVIWQPTFLEFKPDILVIGPKLGFLFLEVKNWDMAKVRKFYLNGKVETNFGIRNPLGQTQNYINELQRLVNSLSGVERDIHRVTTSMVVYAGFNQNDFLIRGEVADWGIAETQSYLSRHIFRDELEINIVARLLQSKKFKAHFLASIINEKELTDLIYMLGEEGHFKEESYESNIDKVPIGLKQMKKTNLTNNEFSLKSRFYILGFLGVLFLLIFFSAFQDFLYNYSDDSVGTSEEWYEENSYSDSVSLKEESFGVTEEEVIMAEETTEVLENTEVTEEETLIVEPGKISNYETDLEEEEVSVIKEVNTSDTVESDVGEDIVTKPGNTFTLGSTKNEVENVMGVPTHISTYRNEWGYGGSTIEFNKNDLVIGWTDYLENLNVSLGEVVGGSFSLGSSKQEVVNAMGTPTSISTYRNEWGYGGSTIEFNENDIVVGWTDYLENLNASLGNAVGEYFTLGSTKQEVVNAMGTPTTISTYRNEWGYGGSTIEFDNNEKVIGWTDYLGNLNASLGNGIGGYFTLGSTKEDVVNAMGTPTSISIYRNEWGYGGSTVEFNENDLVIGWTDYVKNLRVN